MSSHFGPTMAQQLEGTMFAGSPPTPRPTAFQLGQVTQEKEHHGKEEAVEGRLTDAEQTDILGIIEKVARAYPHGFSWESVCDFLPPGLQDRVAFTSVGGGILSRAVRAKFIVATDQTVKSLHPAAKGRRILLYRKAP